MKFEVVISVWDKGLFKLRERIESDDSHNIREEFELAIDRIEKKLIADEERFRKIMEDDDIPF